MSSGRMSSGMGARANQAGIAGAVLCAVLGAGLLCGVAAARAGVRPSGGTSHDPRAPRVDQVGEDGTVLVRTAHPLRGVPVRRRRITTSGTVYPRAGRAGERRPSGPPLNVAVVASASADVGDPFFTDVQNRLLDSGYFASASAINAGLVTPSTEELSAYDAVLVWSNFDFADAATLGDNLADYVNAGGGVVVAVFANSSSTQDRYLGGRWSALDYEIIPTQSGTATGAAALGSIIVPGHPVLDGVSTFSGGSNSFRPEAAALSRAGGVQVVAEWDDGRTLVAVREDTVGSRVDLGFYPVSDEVLPGYWDHTTDGGLLLANALRYAAERVPLAPGDSDADGDVDSDDADAFASCYTGSDAGPVVAGCVTFDFDRDDDVDCLDWNGFVNAWTEPGDPPVFSECNFAAPVTTDIAPRYLSIAPPPVANPVALLVSGDSDDPSVSCLRAYVQADLTLGADPVFQTADAWGQVLLTGSEILPGTAYRVQADHGTPGGALLSPPADTTTWAWGDVNNDTIVDIRDIFCVLDGFQNVFVDCSMQAVDLQPDEPDGVIDILDIFAVLDAFQRLPYDGPVPCP